MRRYFSISFIALALVVSSAGAAPAAYAATCLPGYITDNNGNSVNAADGSDCTVGAGSGAAVNATSIGTSCPPGQVEGAGSQAGQCFDQNQNATGAIPTDTAAAKSVLDLPPNPDMGPAFSGIMVWIMSLFAWLVGVAAITLDNAVYYTVVTMGDYVNKLSAVGVAWRILRDIGNIMLIFGFLAVGITTILNVNWYGGGKKMLPMMLVAAVFLNFSLFISEAIIDTGNLFATQFYTQINGDNPAGAKNLDSASISTEGISNKIMAQVGLQTIYGDVQNGAKAKELLKAGNSWVIGFMAIILFLVTAFMLFSLAFVLIARFVALIFLIIVAPIGFAGLAVPGFAARASQYWTTLFEQTITAPILLLMLYIAIAVITDAQFLTGFCVPSSGVGCTPNWTGFATNNLTGFGSLILSFLVAMALLIAVVVYAKRWSAFGGDMASKAAGKLTFGLTAAGMRSTVGWGTNRLAKMARSSAFSRVPLLGTGVTRGLEGIAKSSFDLRASGALKNVPFASTIALGEAQKGGYKADLKARTESRTKYASELTGRELDKDEKIEQAALQNQVKDLQKKRGKAGSKEEIKAIDAQIKEIEEGKDGKGGEGTLKYLERGTAKDNQNKYASVLELGQKPDGVFNKYFNFAANTDAAKIIRASAKKGKPDKDWTENMKKMLKEAGGEEGGEGPDGGTPGGGGSGGGGGRGGGGGGGSRGTGGGGGGSPSSPPPGFQQNPGGVILTPTGVGGGPRQPSSTGGSGAADIAEEAEDMMRTTGARVETENAARDRARNRVGDADTAHSQAIAEDAAREQSRRNTTYAQAAGIGRVEPDPRTRFSRQRARVGDVDVARSQAYSENELRNRVSTVAENQDVAIDRARTQAEALDIIHGQALEEDAVRTRANVGGKIIIPTNAGGGARRIAANDENIADESRESRRVA